MLFVGERRRSWRAPRRDPRRASLASEAIKRDRVTRRAEEEGVDMLFVGERPQHNCASAASTSPSGELWRRSWRAPRRDPRRASLASEAINMDVNA
jgi:hypothetical protein